jgi:glycosyltransferase involved in cell wall biosynthesis
VGVLVGAIVPVHDGARFLADSLPAITAQTYRRVELVVVDDGSTDDGARIAERRARARLG